MSLRRILPLLLAAALILGAVPAQAVEADTPSAAEPAAQAAAPAPDPDWLPGKWYYSTIQALSAKGINCVWDDGYLHAGQAMTRYDFLRLLNRALGVPVVERGKTVTRQNHLAAAVEAGLIGPEELEGDGPDAPLTRLEAARLLYHALTQLQGERPQCSGRVALFLRDYATVPQELQEAVNTLYTLGILRGSGKRFGGERVLSRAEGLTAVLRLTDPQTRYYPLPEEADDQPILRGDLLSGVNQALGRQAGGYDRQSALLNTLWAAERLDYLPAGWLAPGRLESPLTRYELTAVLARLLARQGEAAEDVSAAELYVARLATLPVQFREDAARCVQAGVLDPGEDYDWNTLVTQGEFYQALSRLLHPEERVDVSLDGFPQVIGSFTTNFDDTTSSAFNIKRAAQLFGERVVEPGGTLNFNRLTGPADESMGYKIATVLSGGQYTLGWGGGVCQTSTTLYNAALLAGFSVVERHNHSLKSAYVDYGRDATVASPYLNLILRNPYDVPVKVVAQWGEGYVSFFVLAPGSLKAPEVTLAVTEDAPHTYTLTRTANGVVDYTAQSVYRN